MFKSKSAFWLKANRLNLYVLPLINTTFRQVIDVSIKCHSTADAKFNQILSSEKCVDGQTLPISLSKLVELLVIYYTEISWVKT